jgi:hypothetical protein
MTRWHASEYKLTLISKEDKCTSALRETRLLCETAYQQQSSIESTAFTSYPAMICPQRDRDEVEAMSFQEKYASLAKRK